MTTKQKTIIVTRAFKGIGAAVANLFLGCCMSTAARI